MAWDEMGGRFSESTQSAVGLDPKIHRRIVWPHGNRTLQSDRSSPLSNISMVFRVFDERKDLESGLCEQVSLE
jgi:hypothetical protein